uniref:Hemerythrin n=1 Tax=Mesochaetopterus taylori TaxID=352254 RepID=A0A1S6QCQ1_9ANNE|nr:hemerythrin [Mesochaetopterus taylori]
MPKLPTVNCPFEVPNPYRWDESFKVFYDNLDGEHRLLFDAVFELETKQDKSSLDKLIDVTVNHFTDEEGMMQKKNYSAYPGHKKMHDDFVAILRSLSVGDCNAETMKFAKEWLVEHIKTTDFKYKTKL